MTLIEQDLKQPYDSISAVVDQAGVYTNKYYLIAPTSTVRSEQTAIVPGKKWVVDRFVAQRSQRSPEIFFPINQPHPDSSIPIGVFKSGGLTCQVHLLPLGIGLEDNLLYKLDIASWANVFPEINLLGRKLAVQDAEISGASGDKNSNDTEIEFWAGWGNDISRWTTDLAYSDFGPKEVVGPLLINAGKARQAGLKMGSVTLAADLSDYYLRTHPGGRGQLRRVTIVPSSDLQNAPEYSHWAALTASIITQLSLARSDFASIGLAKHLLREYKAAFKSNYAVRERMLPVLSYHLLANLHEISISQRIATDRSTQGGGQVRDRGLLLSRERLPINRDRLIQNILEAIGPDFLR